MLLGGLGAGMEIGTDGGVGDRLGRRACASDARQIQLRHTGSFGGRLHRQSLLGKIDEDVADDVIALLGLRMSTCAAGGTDRLLKCK
jgi:hypothetical protein